MRRPRPSRGAGAHRRAQGAGKGCCKVCGKLLPGRGARCAVGSPPLPPLGAHPARRSPSGTTLLTKPLVPRRRPRPRLTPGCFTEKGARGEAFLGGVGSSSAAPQSHLTKHHYHSAQEMQPCVYLRQLQLAFSTARCWSPSGAAKIAHGSLLGLVKSPWQRPQPWQEPD